MANDPELVAETHAWIAKAANDLRAAEALQRTSPPLLDESVFHCQQAAEKALKGFLAWHGQPFRKTHNLEEIGEQCLGVDAALGDLIDRATPLTEYAWKFRYPGDPRKGSTRPRPRRRSRRRDWLLTPFWIVCQATCDPGKKRCLVCPLTEKADVWQSLTCRGSRKLLFATST